MKLVQKGLLNMEIMNHEILKILFPIGNEKWLVSWVKLGIYFKKDSLDINTCLETQL